MNRLKLRQISLSFFTLLFIFAFQNCSQMSSQYSSELQSSALSEPPLDSNEDPLQPTPPPTIPPVVNTPTGRLVFAHYMLAMPTYGNNPTVNSFIKDIQDAQAAGIDGFALNAAAWSSEVRYKNYSALMFQAAESLGTDFKLFFSADVCCDSLSANDIIDMITTYSGRPNYYKRDGKPVLSTFNGQNSDEAWWSNNVLGPLNLAGNGVFFLPFFYTQANGETPVAADVTQLYNRFANILDGLFYFGVAGLPNYTSPSLLSSGEAFASVLNSKQKVFMASFAPQYWGVMQNGAGRRYYEYQGGQGVHDEWQSIINKQKAPLVEIVTWNDFGESYISPVVGGDYRANLPTTGANAVDMEPGMWKPHGGLLELTKYYIQWYKADAQPAIAKDSMYYFYRTHPKDAVASRDPRPVTQRVGPVADNIYVTTLLTSPAVLQVSTGGRITNYNVPAGITHTQIPFLVGAQRFNLIRNGVSSISLTGENIIANPVVYNFFYTTGFGYGF